MGELLAYALHHARRQTLELASGVPDTDWCRQAVPGERHPAWLLGHLLLGDVYLLAMLGVWPLADDFSDLLDRYGPGAPPVESAGRYVRPEELVGRLTETGSARCRAVARMTGDELSRPTPDPMLARSQPTVGHHLHGLVLHEGYHAGQLSSWRRAHRLSPVRWALAPDSGSTTRFGFARPGEVAN